MKIVSYTASVLLSAPRRRYIAVRKMPRNKRKNEKPSESRKLSVRIIISRVLIIVGVLLIGLAAGYELINYPWQTFGVSDRAEWHDPEYLADPPLDSGNTLVKPSALVSSSPAQTPAAPSGSPSPGSSEPTPTPTATPSPSQTTLPGQGDTLLPQKKPAVKPDPIGIIKIPKLNQSLFIYEDTTLYILGFGVGHVLNTPYMGQPGNVCLAGHRSTASMHPFRYLDMLGEGDIVVLKDTDHTYTYTVYEQFIVLESEYQILFPVAAEEYCLTLITCHPYGFRTHRLVVRARLTDIDGVPTEEFYAVPSGEPSPSGDATAETPEDPSVSPGPGNSPDPSVSPDPSADHSPSPGESADSSPSPGASAPA